MEREEIQLLKKLCLEEKIKPIMTKKEFMSALIQEGTSVSTAYNYIFLFEALEYLKDDKKTHTLIFDIKKIKGETK